MLYKTVTDALSSCNSMPIDIGEVRLTVLRESNGHRDGNGGQSHCYHDPLHVGLVDAVYGWTDVTMSRKAIEKAYRHIILMYSVRYRCIDNFFGPRLSA